MKLCTAGLLAIAILCAAPPVHAASPVPNRPGAATPAAPTAAPAPSGPANALQGFSQNRDKPLKISAASLEVRDKDKVATFAGDVHLVQGDTTLRSKTLMVFYDDDSASKESPAKDSGSKEAASKEPAPKEPSPKPAKPAAAAGAPDAPPMSQQIRRVEAKGGVLVTQKDQTATGESGIFDMQANTVTLVGNVVISQGQNVVKGDRLTVDLTSGVSRVECGKSQGQCRVQALLQPNSIHDKPGSETGSIPAPGAHDAARPRAPTAGLH
jgi:lipopolysaccharide export system protein LptA